jgi:translation initiation factor 5B
VGIPEVMMLIAGLSQRFLEKKLDINVDGPAKATVLEVKETLGFGTTLDVIVYDGTLHAGDIIIIGARNDVVTTKVRALLKPKPLDEIRDPRYKFDTVPSVSSAAGIKIAAPGLDEVLSGSPLLVASQENVDEVKRVVHEEISRFRINRDTTGIIVKADTLGSLEAIVGTLRRQDISIRNADIGDVQKRDIVEAISVAETNPLDAAILAFNVNMSEEVEEMAKQADIPVMRSNIIYKLIEDYEEYITEKRREEEERKKMGVIMPGKFQFLPKMVFRNAKPAIVGIEVLAGTVMPRLDVINEEGIKVGKIKALKEKNDFLKVAKKGQQVAMSIEGPIVGRQIHEGEILYIDMPKSNIDRLKEINLPPEEEEVVSFLSKLKKKDIFAGV